MLQNQVTARCSKTGKVMSYYFEVGQTRHTNVSTLKKTISIDEDVAKAASAIAPNFSAVVEAALIEYIQHHRAEKALRSFGKWGVREESSAEYVSNLRRQDDREFITHAEPVAKKRRKKNNKKG